MCQWLQGSGIDVSGKFFVVKVGENDVSFIICDGWCVIYVNWESDVVSGQMCFKCIDFICSMMQVGKVVICIVIDGWKKF